MLDCGHIFCLQCLRGFYSDTINEGNLSAVRCLAPNCAKERASAQIKPGSANKTKTAISPSELLQIGLSEDMVKRYVTLKYKTELESDKTTVYCPRQWCNGAARSKRHRKPEGLEFADVSDDGSDQENSTESEAARPSKKDRFNRADLLSICEDCGFAFCSQCFQSWHGEFFRCIPRRDHGELSEEDKASIEYLQLHTSPCPTCNAPAQKTHGCNHMICSRCDTHFCYLCSAWLDPTNPYRHYNQQPNGKVTSCYMRLWELEGGDGDDVGLGFIGGRAVAQNQQAPALNEIELLPEVIEFDDSDPEDGEDVNFNNNRPLDANGQAIEVAREGPLVIRLVDNQPRGRPVPPAAPDAPQPAGGGQHVPPRGHLGRGRGARGGGRAAPMGARGRGGNRGGVANRPRHQPRQQQQPQQQPAQDQGDGNVNFNFNNDNNNNQAGLDPAQEAWVRRFVQMALMDEEDLVEGDSDEEGDNWVIH